MYSENWRKFDFHGENHRGASEAREAHNGNAGCGAD